METVNKSSPLHMTATFKDENGADKVPTTAQWRVWDKETDTEVLTWQDLVPAISVNFVVEGDYNTINDATKTRELREVQVRIDVGLATEAYEEMSYYVMNRPGGV